MSTDPAVWIGGILTLLVYSFLFKGENAAYSLAEHLMIGAAGGWGLVMAYHNLRTLVFDPVVREGAYSLLIPTAFGLLLYGRYFKKTVALSRLPLAFMVSLAAGVAVRGAIQSDIIEQLKGTLMPLDSVDNVVFVAGVVAVMWYFFISFQRGGAIGAGFAKFGRYLLMVSFAAIFSSAVAGRFTVLVTHLQYLVYTWAGYVV